MVLDSSELRHMPVYYDNQAPRRDVVFVIYAYDACKGLKFAAYFNTIASLMVSLNDFI